MARRTHPARKQPRDAAGRFSRSPSSTSSTPSSGRHSSSNPRPQRRRRHAVEARVEVDLDHAVHVEVPFVPMGFRSAMTAPRKNGGIVIVVESSSSRRKNKQKSRHLYTQAWPTTESDAEMGIDDFGLRGCLYESKGKKYEFCFPKIQCKMMLNYDSDENEYDGPTKSLREIYQMAEDLRVAVKRKHQRGEFYTQESDRE